MHEEEIHFAVPAWSLWLTLEVMQHLLEFLLEGDSQLAVLLLLLSVNIHHDQGPAECRCNLFSNVLAMEHIWQAIERNKHVHT